jgi:AcrR family transcriptional regulator
MARPTTPLLSTHAIATAALRIIDADGLAALSMRRLAADLGVSSPSLYHHYASKDEILDAIVDEINAGITLADASPDWETALQAYAYQLREALSAHPHVVEFVALRPVTAHSGLRIYEHMISQLASCGWDAALAREITLAVENLVYGAALMANAPDIELSEEQREIYPTLARLADQPHQAPDDGFEVGFAALIDGLRRRAGEQL